MRSVITYAGIGLYLILSIPFLLVALILSLCHATKAKDKLVAALSKHWAKMTMALAGMKVEISIEGKVPEGPVVFVSNHQSDFDTLIHLGCLGRPIGFVAKKEIKKVPILAQWMMMMNCVFIDRKHPAGAMKVLLSDTVKKLQAGYSIIINPEGTRSKCDDVGKFKYGGFKMAQEAGVPLVPVAIDGSYRAWEGNNRKVTPCTVRMIILPAVDMAALSEEEAKVIHETVRQQIIDAKDAGKKTA